MADGHAVPAKDNCVKARLTALVRPAVFVISTNASITHGAYCENVLMGGLAWVISKASE